jgi:hypothetical protein
VYRREAPALIADQCRATELRILAELQIRRIDASTIAYTPRDPVEQPRPGPAWDRALQRFLGIPTGSEGGA